MTQTIVYDLEALSRKRLPFDPDLVKEANIRLGVVPWKGYDTWLQEFDIVEAATANPFKQRYLISRNLHAKLINPEFIEQTQALRIILNSTVTDDTRFLEQLEKYIAPGLAVFYPV